MKNMAAPLLNIVIDDLITNTKLLKIQVYSLLERKIIDKGMDINILRNIQETLLLEPYLHFYLKEENSLDINQILIGYLVNSNEEIEFIVKSDFLG